MNRGECTRRAEGIYTPPTPVAGVGWHIMMQVGPQTLWRDTLHGGCCTGRFGLTYTIRSLYLRDQRLFAVFTQQNKCDLCSHINFSRHFPLHHRDGKELLTTILPLLISYCSSYERSSKTLKLHYASFWTLKSNDARINVLWCFSKVQVLTSVTVLAGV